jgi:hypothetical protein
MKMNGQRLIPFASAIVVQMVCLANGFLIAGGRHS